METTCRKFLAGNAFGGFCDLRAPLETRFIGAKFVNPEIRAHFERRRAFVGADVQFRFSKSRADHRGQQWRTLSDAAKGGGVMDMRILLDTW